MRPLHMIDMFIDKGRVISTSQTYVYGEILRLCNYLVRQHAHIFLFAIENNSHIKNLMKENTNIDTTLFTLEKNRPARILGFACSDEHSQTRLREIGFAEGDLVEISHIGLFGRSPLNVKLHGTSIAMRPSEARLINVIPADLHREITRKFPDEEIKIEIGETLPCCDACGDD